MFAGAAGTVTMLEFRILGPPEVPRDARALAALADAHTGLGEAETAAELDERARAVFTRPPVGRGYS